MKTKKNIFLLLSSFILIFNTGCDDENETFKTFDGVVLSFRTADFEVSIPEEDLSLEIPVSISTLSNSARTFNASITSATDGTSNEYTIGTITIPANEYEGSLNVDFDFSEIGGMDGDIKELVLSMDLPAGTSSSTENATIKYFREIVCNDLELKIISDVWATETYVTIEQADGTVIINRFFPFSSDSTTPQEFIQSFNLPNGDYVLKIGDTFGDGMIGSSGGIELTGSYELTCSIITHASGGGALAGVPDPFPGAADAIVEVTNFSVNP